jgi:hypothetical protein
LFDFFGFLLLIVNVVFETMLFNAVAVNELNVIFVKAERSDNYALEIQHIAD